MSQKAVSKRRVEMEENVKMNMEDFSLTDDLFVRVGTEGLSGEEIGRKSLTYWADVWRRFRSRERITSLLMPP